MSATVDFVMDYIYDHGTMWVSPIMRNGRVPCKEGGSQTTRHVS
jgi:hypothetical protein